jgi:hypothetical protein
MKLLSGAFPPKNLRYTKDSTGNAVSPFHVEDALELVHTHFGIGPEESAFDRSHNTHIMPSGLTLYFSHSTAHCSSPIGGRMPVIGSHSVILSPDSVSLVKPPTMMMKKTMPEHAKSQVETLAGASRGGRVASVAASTSATFPIGAASVDACLGRAARIRDLVKLGSVDLDFEKDRGVR